MESQTCAEQKLIEEELELQAGTNANSPSIEAVSSFSHIDYIINPEMQALQPSELTYEELKAHAAQLLADCAMYKASNQSLLAEIHQSSCDYMTVLSQNSALKNQLREQAQNHLADLQQITQLALKVAKEHSLPIKTKKPPNFIKQAIGKLSAKLTLYKSKNTAFIHESKNPAHTHSVSLKKETVNKSGPLVTQKGLQLKEREARPLDELDLLQDIRDLSSTSSSLARLQRFQDLHRKYADYQAKQQEQN